jgi:hypothetical protein
MANSPKRDSIPIEEQNKELLLLELLKQGSLPTRPVELIYADGCRVVHKLVDLITLPIAIAFFGQQKKILLTPAGYAWLRAVSTEEKKAILSQLLFKGFTTDSDELGVLRDFFKNLLTDEKPDFVAAYLWLESAREISYLRELNILNTMLGVCLELLLMGNTESFTGLFRAARQLRAARQQGRQSSEQGKQPPVTSKIEIFYLLPVLLTALAEKMQEEQTEPLPWLQEFKLEASDSKPSAILTNLLSSLYLPKARLKWRIGKILLVTLCRYGHQLPEDIQSGFLMNLLRRWQRGEFTINDIEIAQILRVAVKAGNLVAFQLCWENQFQPQVIGEPIKQDKNTPAFIFSYALHEGINSGNFALVLYFLYKQREVGAINNIAGSAFCRGLIDVNAFHPTWGTALHVIANKLKTHPEKKEALLAIAQQLCSLGANLWIKNKKGETPLDIYPDFYHHSLPGLHDLGYQVAFEFSFPHNYLVLFSWMKGAILAGKLESMFGGNDIQCMIGGRLYSRKITEGSLWIYKILEDFIYYGFLRITPMIQKKFETKFEVFNKVRRRPELTTFYEKFLALCEQRPHPEKTCLHPPLISMVSNSHSLPSSSLPTSSTLVGSSVDFTLFDNAFCLTQLFAGVTHLMNMTAKPTRELLLLPEERVTSLAELVRDLGLLENPERVINWLEALYQQGMARETPRSRQEELFIKSEKSKHPLQQLFDEQTVVFVLDYAVKQSKEGALRNIYIYLEVEMSVYPEDAFQIALGKALSDDREERLLYELVQHFKQMIFTNVIFRETALLPANRKALFPRLMQLFSAVLDSVCRLKKFEPSVRFNLLRVACYYNRVNLFLNVMQDWHEIATLTVEEQSELLSLAIQRGSSEVVSVLLASSTILSLDTPYRVEENIMMDLLHFAVSKRQFQIVKLLLEYGADPNQTHGNFGTALHTIVKNICDPKQAPYLPLWLRIADLLCAYGASLSVKHQGITAFELIKAQYKQARRNSQISSSGAIMGPPPRISQGLLDTEEQIRKGYAWIKQLKQTTLLLDVQLKAWEEMDPMTILQGVYTRVVQDLLAGRYAIKESELGSTIINLMPESGLAPMFVDKWDVWVYEMLKQLIETINSPMSNVVKEVRRCEKNIAQHFSDNLQEIPKSKSHLYENFRKLPAFFFEIIRGKRNASLFLREANASLSIRELVEESLSETSDPDTPLAFDSDTEHNREAIADGKSGSSDLCYSASY